MNHALIQLIVCVVILLNLVNAGLVLAQEKPIGVLLSREIAPYVEMVEGLESGINLPVQRFFFDKNGAPYSLSGQNSALDPFVYGALVAVGPDAFRYLSSAVDKSLLVYGMVLSPENVVDDPTGMPCGISLNISAESQFSSILRYLPALKRLGVLFDPMNNQVWFEDAAEVAEARGFELVPVQISNREGRVEMAGDFAHLDAILFIPDKSIISKAVIQYVIKQGIINKTPTIGYNRFFYDSGAALNFMIDYHKVGQQVARQVERLLAGKQCEEAVLPFYEVAVNEDIWHSLHLGARADSTTEGAALNAAPKQ